MVLSQSRAPTLPRVTSAGGFRFRGFLTAPFTSTDDSMNRRTLVCRSLHPCYALPPKDKRWSYESATTHLYQLLKCRCVSQGRTHEFRSTVPLGLSKMLQGRVFLEVKLLPLSVHLYIFCYCKFYGERSLQSRSNLSPKRRRPHTKYQMVG